jgi:hypothetical protein
LGNIPFLHVGGQYTNEQIDKVHNNIKIALALAQMKYFPKDIASGDFADKLVYYIKQTSSSEHMPKPMFPPNGTKLLDYILLWRTANRQSMENHNNITTPNFCALLLVYEMLIAKYYHHYSLFTKNLIQAELIPALLNIITEDAKPMNRPSQVLSHKILQILCADPEFHDIIVRKNENLLGLYKAVLNAKRNEFRLSAHLYIRQLIKNELAYPDKCRVKVVAQLPTQKFLGELRSNDLSVDSTVTTANNQIAIQLRNFLQSSTEEKLQLLHIDKNIVAVAPDNTIKYGVRYTDLFAAAFIGCVAHFRWKRLKVPKQYYYNTVLPTILGYTVYKGVVSLNLSRLVNDLTLFAKSNGKFDRRDREMVTMDTKGYFLFYHFVGIARVTVVLIVLAQVRFIILPHVLLVLGELVSAQYRLRNKHKNQK